MKIDEFFLKISFLLIIISALTACGGGNDNKEGQTGIIFLADKVVPQTELYYTDILGNEVQKLNHALPENADIYDFAVSPNGKYVAYSANSGLGTIIELYIGNTDGSRAYKVSGIFQVSQINGVGQFDWSPDSTKLAYLATGRNNNLQNTLYVTSINNEPSINVTPQATVGSFVWSPDSKYIAYAGDKLNVSNSLGIYVVDKAGQVETKVSGDIAANELVYGDGYFWSPNGLHLTYLKRNASFITDLFTVLPDGTENNNLSNGVNVNLEQWSWAPDSSRLAYSLDQMTTGIFELFTVLPNGTNIKKISKPLNVNEDVFEFYWAPDSSKIVYRSIDSLAITNELYTVTPDGLNQTKISVMLASGESVLSRSIAWAPNGSFISYLANPGGINSQLFIVKPDGTNLLSVSNSEIFNNNVYAYPIWSPKNNHIAFQVSLQSGVKLYTFNPNDQTLIRFSQDTIFGIDPITFHSVKWFSDGTNLIYKATPSIGFISELYSASINTGLETNVTGSMNFDSVGRYQYLE